MRLGRFHPNKRQVCILAFGKAKKIRGTSCKARATTVCVVGRRGVRPKKRKRPSKKKKKVQLRKEKGTLLGNTDRTCFIMIFFSRLLMVLFVCCFLCPRTGIQGHLVFVLSVTHCHSVAKKL